MGFLKPPAAPTPGTPPPAPAPFISNPKPTQAKKSTVPTFLGAEKTPGAEGVGMERSHTLLGQA